MSVFSMDANGEITIDLSKDSKVAAAMAAHTPEEQVAAAEALRLETLQANFFAHAESPERALEAAQDKLNLQQEITKALASPKEGMLTAKYLQAFQAVHPGRDEQMTVPLLPNRYAEIYLPAASFTLANSNEVGQICFGRPGGRYTMPYGVCGERKETQK